MFYILSYLKEKSDSLLKYPCQAARWLRCLACSCLGFKNKAKALLEGIIGTLRVYTSCLLPQGRPTNWHGTQQQRIGGTGLEWLFPGILGNVVQLKESVNIDRERKNDRECILYKNFVQAGEDAKEMKKEILEYKVK